jgi:DNA-binding NtrC family response regulator
MTANSVIVVDDDRLTRESLCEVLADLGCRVRDAAGGLLAYDLIRSEATDMVVSDVDMPDISGFELLARLQGANFTNPVILISARADADLRRRARESGAAELFAKPVKIQPFTSLIHLLLPKLTTETDERPNHG